MNPGPLVLNVKILAEELSNVDTVYCLIIIAYFGKPQKQDFLLLVLYSLLIILILIYVMLMIASFLVAICSLEPSLQNSAKHVYLHYPKITNGPLLTFFLTILKVRKMTEIYLNSELNKELLFLLVLWFNSPKKSH